jgi:hypothetical protein
MPLHEALATALDLAGKVNRQGHEAATQLSLRPLPGREGSLRGFRGSDIVWRRIGMAPIRILLNLEEGSVLGRVVFS